MRTLPLASALFAGLFGSLCAVPAPYHAFCSSLWLFTTPCTEVSIALVQQIQAFSPLMGCDECQYSLVSATPLTISANHTSPDGLQAESITFSLSPDVLTSGCKVYGMSKSLSFTDLIDGGLNYCNLYNLLAASGLTKDPGFMELTNEWACLGYQLSSCSA